METTEKFMKAAKHYLTIRGFEVKEEIKDDKLIAIDHEDDRFVLVYVRAFGPDEKDKFLEPAKIDRVDFEKSIIDIFLTSNLIQPDISVAADVVSILQLSSDRAFVRHHINASQLNLNDVEEVM